MGYVTIADLARDRVSRVIAAGGTTPGDAAFRAFRLAPSSLRRWSGVADLSVDAYLEQLDAFADTMEPGWKPDNVVWEVALREGLGLTAAVERLGEDGATFRVSDEERGRAFTICLDDAVPADAARRLGLGRDDLFICRATALDDTLSANLALQCRLKVL